jgi:hypothetical protein
MTEGWLYGWKQIAAHMGCDIKTAKIYHYRFGMPVLFGPGGGRIALPEQLTPWLIKFNRKLPANTLTRHSNLPKKTFA